MFKCITIGLLTSKVKIMKNYIERLFFGTPSMKRGKTLMGKGTVPEKIIPILEQLFGGIIFKAVRLKSKSNT